MRALQRRTVRRGAVSVVFAWPFAPISRYRKDQPAALRRALFQYAAGNEVSSIQQTSFGAKYLIDGRISGPNGNSAGIRSIWFIEVGECGPRLITAYPSRGVTK